MENQEQQHSTIVHDAEFRLAMHNLSILLAKSMDIMHRWRHEVAEHMRVNTEMPLGPLEIRLKHWLDHHQECQVIHTPGQFLDALQKFRAVYDDMEDNTDL